MKNRLMSVLLAAILCISLLPVSALATESNQYGNNVYRSLKGSAPAISGTNAMGTGIPYTGNPVFSSASLSLDSGEVTDINFKVNKSDLAGAANVSVKFNFNGKETVGVDSSSAGDSYAVYKFKGIEPQQMTDDVTATLSVTYGETTVSSEMTYSVKQYCLNQLSSTNATGELKTLMVDMLRYGAAAQEYLNYKTNNLATAGLTAQQLALGSDTSAALSLTQVDQKITAMTSGEKKVKWTAASLRLEGDVAIRLKFSKLENAAIADDISVKYTVDDGTDTYDATVTAASNGNYVCYINMPVDKMGAVIHAVVYEGNNAISSTINYSVESYAAAMQGETADGLGELVKAMIRFGRAADTFVQTPSSSSTSPSSPDSQGTAESTSTISVGGVVIRSQISGSYSVTGFQGFAVRMDADAIRALAGISGTPFVRVSDATANNNSAAFAVLNAAAASQGATVLGAIRVDLGQMNGGRFSSLPTTVSVPATLGVAAAGGRKLAVVKVQPGGAFNILLDDDEIAMTVTFHITGGLAVYGVIAY
ncbi:MAG: hypothetical protein IJT49_01825 [Clostridia bacterium]|nr:hypothetical protein [Clostridia bacterium]